MNDDDRQVGTLPDAQVQRAVRCATCGGLNPPAATWCGQCHTRFDAPSALSPAPTGAPPSAAPPASAVPAPPAFGPSAAAVDAPGRTGSMSEAAFRVTEEGITWTCSTCEAVNDLELAVCHVCGAPFAKTVLPDDEKPPRDPNMAALVSLFMPGAGHAYIGHWGQAIARAVVSLWVVMVVFVAALQRGAASSNVVMAVFGLAAVALWGVAAHDAYREARGERALVILKGKVFFYVVLGLLLLLVALLMNAMIKAQGV